MGILDDAIREHLELKRKHGVPEEEVERQQEEALGPARREVAQQPEDAGIAADEVVPAAATEGDGPTAGDEAGLFDGEHHGAAAAEEPLGAEPTSAADETAVLGASAPEHEPALADRPLDEPLPAEPPVADHTGMEPPPAEEAPGDTEPHGFPALDDEEPEADEDFAVADSEVADSEDEDSEDEELDVLEDTPDFLQETPEHDRLWFEQKPPRDFDFD